MNRGLFLDFDGVLHPAGIPGSVLPFEWVAVLNELLAAHPDVGIVVHSTWRDVYPEDALREFLNPLDQRLLGVVGTGEKPQAIASFAMSRPDIEDWLVLEDEKFDVPGLFCNFVICDPTLGISEPAVQERLRRWLEGGIRQRWGRCATR